MRISTIQIYNQGINSIQDVTQQQQKTQQQLATGRRVLNPSDDPVASTRILELNQELSINNQFQRNIELAEGRLTLQDDRLGGINDVIQRIRELAVTAGNGALTADDLGSIAAEVEERLDQTAGLLNSRDATGEYVFAGFQGAVEPFQLTDSGAYRYQGDQGQRFVKIESSVSVAVTENGYDIFQNIPSYTNTFFTEASTSNQAVPAARISVGQITDQALYDAFYPEDMVIQFNTPTDFNIIEKSTGVTIQSNVPYSSNGPISVNGVQFEIVGAPVAGDSFTVNSSEKQGLLTTIEKFIYGLRNINDTAAGKESFNNLLESTIANLDSAETSVLEVRGQVGARLNTIEASAEQLKDAEILTQDVLNTLEAVDYAETVSLLTVQQFTLEAAYSSFSKITSLSLFERI